MTISKPEGTAAEVLESGNVHFLYRPRIGKKTVAGVQDVQRFLMVLNPQASDVYRLIVLGGKELPRLEDRKGRTWGFVDRVERGAKLLEQSLGPQEYETKTRGHRKLEGCRPVAQGVYLIARHSEHAHFAYKLAQPTEAKEVQRSFEISEEASYILSVKNPAKRSPRWAGLKGAQKADFPPELTEKFGGRRFVAPDTPTFLNYVGAELFLAAAGEDIESELDLSLEPEIETQSTDELLRDLRTTEERFPARPLFTGQWT